MKITEMEPISAIRAESCWNVASFPHKMISSCVLSVFGSQLSDFSKKFQDFVCTSFGGKK